MGRGVRALLSEPMERKSGRENARTGGRGMLSTGCLPIPIVVPNRVGRMRGLSEVAWEALLRVIRLR